MLPLTNKQLATMLQRCTYALRDDGTLYDFANGSSIRPESLALPDVSKHREAIALVREAVQGLREAENKRIDSGYADERAAFDANSWGSTLVGYRLMLRATMPPLTAIAILHAGHKLANEGRE